MISIKLFQNLKLKNSIVIVFASVFLAFGLYNVHSVSYVTEGGILGLVLLVEHLFDISPSVSGFVMNSVCYIFGWKTLGKQFVAYSVISIISFSLAYRVFECYPPLWPQLYNYPFISAIVGALFVGVGVGVCVLFGAAPSGDDALAMSIAKKFAVKIQYVYLISDMIVLILSLTYIPINRIIFSMLTVILSGQIIGYIQRLNFFGK